MNLAEMKETVVYGCKVLAFEGQRDGIWGHVSLRLPDKNTYLMKPWGLGLEEVTPDDLVTLTLEGEKIAGHQRPHTELPIHAEIYRARPDVNCVVHTHPAAPIAFSSLGGPLLPLSNEGCVFFEELPVYCATTDLIREKERGQELAACLGTNRAVLLRNHGIVTVGQTVGEAVMMAIFLDRACRMQLLAMQSGPIRYSPPAEEARSKKRKHAGKPGDGRMDIAFSYFVRQVKLMEASGRRY